MNVNKESMNMRFSNYRDLLSDESLIYIYGKDKELATRQLSFVKKICKSKNIPTSKIYMDIGSSNKLDFKINLKN